MRNLISAFIQLSIRQSLLAEYKRDLVRRIDGVFLE
jgi:hypothetical protein